MTTPALQFSVVRLAAAIRQMPDGDQERQVRMWFLRLVEELQGAAALVTQDWDVGARHQDTLLWTLQNTQRRATAVLRCTEGYGYEVRVFVDDELCQARMFRHEQAAVAFARARRSGLRARGWRAW
ncbi:MAG: hypothetical protein KA745_03605 [Gemmatimonadales bacterium]|nr:hypothetical protein [Gemmatimonadales bacterium]